MSCTLQVNTVMQEAQVTPFPMSCDLQGECACRDPNAQEHNQKELRGFSLGSAKISSVTDSEPELHLMWGQQAVGDVHGQQEGKLEQKVIKGYSQLFDQFAYDET
ncbi:hypothetical protein DV515_00008893 [Chloebia gouldiae]|uniref:Uncharacterized protein n=1 Tax=Chloebia gouldiae TaxID=44316 RepID=A0A3L8SF65_CHLGU|nr:hypothetical protein DV515_00008893 [Chloebia gouldiae]